jgi:NitT/TauT family transport system substrate-binding protein
MTLSRGNFIGAAAAFAATPLAAAAADPVVSVGTIPTDVSAVVNYALDLGYFKDVGLDVRLTTLTSGPVVATAVAGGAVDVGAANVGSLAVARARGVPIRVFAPAGLADAHATGDIIAVLKDSPIQTAADLNNKTIGIVAVKTMQHAAVLLWIDRHGGDSKSVKFIEIPFPEMFVALQSHRVDAILPDEPFTTMMSAHVRSLGNQWSAMREPFLIFGFFATENWLNAHPDLATKFSSAIIRAARWANGHRSESALILARYTKIDPKIASRMGRTTYGTSLDASMIQPVVENLVRYGLLEKPIDASDLLWHPSGR